VFSLPLNVACSFCGKPIEPGTGLMFVRNDNQRFQFCSRKCERNLIALRRRPRRIKWTTSYERGPSPPQPEKPAEEPVEQAEEEPKKRRGRRKKPSPTKEKAEEAPVEEAVEEKPAKKPAKKAAAKPKKEKAEEPPAEEPEEPQGETEGTETDSEEKGPSPEGG
jgi:large subunit ribosomal protein L24e